jgi:chromosome segregation ATPase
LEPSPETLKALADAMNAYDDAVKALIVEELNTTVRPGLEAARDQAAARLAEAYAAIDPLRQQMSEADERISYAESELATYRADLESAEVSTRAHARSFATEWETELDALRKTRARHLDAVNAAVADHRKAQDALAQAEMALGDFEMNLESDSR